jgi:hypothetical protein
MDWRTSDEKTRFKSDAEHLDRREAGFSPLAGTAHPTFEQAGHRRIRLGTTLFNDLQVARGTRGRFGGDVAGREVIE